jgi:hypothetical protein
MTIKAAIEYAIRSTEMENGPMSPESRALMQQSANQSFNPIRRDI